MSSGAEFIRRQQTALARLYPNTIYVEMGLYESDKMGPDSLQVKCQKAEYLERQRSDLRVHCTVKDRLTSDLETLVAEEARALLQAKTSSLAKDLHRALVVSLHVEGENGNRVTLDFPNQEELAVLKSCKDGSEQERYAQNVILKRWIGELKKRKIDPMQFLLVLKLVHQGSFVDSMLYVNQLDKEGLFLATPNDGLIKVNVFIDKQGNVRLEAPKVYKIVKFDKKGNLQKIRTVALRTTFDLKERTITLEEERESHYVHFARGLAGRDFKLPLNIYKAIKEELGGEASGAQLFLAGVVSACVFFLSILLWIGRLSGTLIGAIPVGLYSLYRHYYPMTLVQKAISDLIAEVQEGNKEKIANAYERLSKAMIAQAKLSKDPHRALVAIIQEVHKILGKKIRFSSADSEKHLKPIFIDLLAQEYLEHIDAPLFDEETIRKLFGDYAEETEVPLFREKLKAKLPRTCKDLCEELRGFDRKYLPLDKACRLHKLMQLCEDLVVPLDGRTVEFAYNILLKYRTLEESVSPICERALEALFEEAEADPDNYAEVLTEELERAKVALRAQCAEAIANGILEVEEIDALVDKKFAQKLAKEFLEGRVPQKVSLLEEFFLEHQALYPLFCVSIEENSSHFTRIQGQLVEARNLAPLALYPHWRKIASNPQQAIEEFEVACKKATLSSRCEEAWNRAFDAANEHWYDENYAEHLDKAFQKERSQLHTEFQGILQPAQVDAALNETFIKELTYAILTGYIPEKDARNALEKFFQIPRNRSLYPLFCEHIKRIDLNAYEAELGEKAGSVGEEGEQVRAALALRLLPIWRAMAAKPKEEIQQSYHRRLPEVAAVFAIFRTAGTGRGANRRAGHPEEECWEIYAHTLQRELLQAKETLHRQFARILSTREIDDLLYREFFQKLAAECLKNNISKRKCLDKFFQIPGNEAFFPTFLSIMQDVALKLENSILRRKQEIPDAIARLSSRAAEEGVQEQIDALHRLLEGLERDLSVLRKKRSALEEDARREEDIQRVSSALDALGFA